MWWCSIDNPIMKVSWRDPGQNVMFWEPFPVHGNVSLQKNVEIFIFPCHVRPNPVKARRNVYVRSLRTPQTPPDLPNPVLHSDKSFLWKTIFCSFSLCLGVWDPFFDLHDVLSDRDRLLGTVALYNTRRGSMLTTVTWGMSLPWGPQRLWGQRTGFLSTILGKSSFSRKLGFSQFRLKLGRFWDVQG